MTVLGFFSGGVGRATPIPAEEWATREIRGRSVGVVSLGDGDPAVFLHGWGLTQRPYLPALRALAARGYRIHAPALPGFGHSAPLRPWSMGINGIADHLAALVEALDLGGPVPVIGHSFGGGVALRLASQRPDLVSSLTLFSPVGGAAAGVVRIPEMISARLHQMTPATAVGQVRWFWPTVLRRPIAMACAAHAAHHANLITEARAARGAGVPVRLVLAATDSIVRPGDLPTCAPGITAVTTPGDHSWLLGDPARFADHAAPDRADGAQMALFT